MSDPPTEDFTAGWAQFHDGTGWHEAQFRVAANTGQLVVASEDRTPAALPLVRITAVDEILGAPAGLQHVEISVGGVVAMDAVWPEGFAGELTLALLATLDEPEGDEGVEDVEPEDVEPEVVRARLFDPLPEPYPRFDQRPVAPPPPPPVGGIVVDTSDSADGPVLDLRDDSAGGSPAESASDDASELTVIEGGPPKTPGAQRRSRAGIIGALALIGCGAVIVGVLGLRNQPERNEREPVETSTTVGSTTTSTSTTVAPAVDEPG